MRLRPSVTAALVTGAVAAAVVAATLAGPTHETTVGSGPRPDTSVQPVTDATLVCPSAPAATSVTTTLVTAAGPAGPGTLTLARLGDPPAARPLAVAAAGATSLRYYTTKAVGGPLVVHATGALARGLTAQALVRTVNGRARALSSQPCTTSGAETWLVGGSAAPGRRDVIYLSNPEQAPAVVDITVYTPQGPQALPSAQGITVAPGRQVAVGLDTLVPGQTKPVVAVHTRSGRVAAAMIDIATNGDIPQGQDWVPPSSSPSLHQVVTGIPADAGARRTLTVLVPGADDANVRVRLATPEGTLSPEQTQGIDAPGGQTVTFPLDSLNIAGAYALLVDSDRPVVAGVRTERGGSGTLVDFSYAGSTPPMAGTGVVLPVAASDPGTLTQLMLTAPGSTDVVARVTPRDQTGRALAATQVTVTAGRTVVVPVGVFKAGYTTVLVQTSGEVPLVVGWVLTVKGLRGPLVTGGPLLQTPLVLVLPPVVPDPSAGLPGT